MNDANALTVPRIHLNGTSKDDLYAQYEKATDALYAAIKAVEGTAPNGRDYYVIDDKAFTKAAREHSDRLARLNAVRAELNVILEAVAS